MSSFMVNNGLQDIRARICGPFKESRNRFPTWRACMTTIFVVLARQATYAGGINSSESIPGLQKRLQIQAQRFESWTLQSFLDKLKNKAKFTNAVFLHFL